MKQQTIQTSVSLQGKGLHTGKEVSLRLLPAAENTGIQFQRTDLADRPIIKADVSALQPSQRATVLGNGAVLVATPEHLLAALMSQQIDNVLIEMDGEEVPILDGSALPFMEAIVRAGIQTQEADCEELVIEEPIQLKDEHTGAEYWVLPADSLELTAMIDFPTLGKQYASLMDLAQFGTEIAPARTFSFLHELEMLLDSGLIKGGDLNNAVVFVDKALEKTDLERLAKKLNLDAVDVLPKQGVLNTTALRFDNEAARHKLLDVLGDLALVGKRIRGRVIATKPGHASNAKLAKKLKEVLKEQLKKREIPQYDPNKEPIYDNIEIAKRLQHRFPFLLIDKIIEISKTHVVGVKNVTANEPFFPGHFPGNPVMPGVLQIEAMAQTGGLLVLETIEDPHSWDTYFLKIDKAVFRHKVVPGDTLLFKMELMRPIRRGLCEMTAKAFVGNKLVAEAELLAQIIKRK